MRLATLAAVTLAFAIAVPVPGHAESPGLLTVSGQGEAAAKPDMATVRIGTVSEADTAAAALTENSTELQAVIDQVKSAGVEPRDIQTSGFSVSPRYADQRNSSTERHIVGYVVSNAVTVRIRKLDGLGALLDTLVKAGANDIGGIQFAISDTSELKDTARIAAIADAKHKAEIYAKAAGVELGAIRAIDEGGVDIPRPQPMMRMEAMASAPMPVEAGEETVSARVRLVFEIQPKAE